MLSVVLSRFGGRGVRRWLAPGTIMLVGIASGLVSPPRTDGAIREIRSGVDWCAVANTLLPGDELVLAGGQYSGSCTIRTGGRPGAPIVIRAADVADRPQLVFLGSKANVITVFAGSLTFRGLRFGPTLPDVDGIRIKSGDDITIEKCEFTDLGGIAIVSNNTIRRITIRDNEVRRSKATAIYLGCHDGAECRVTDAVIESNHVDGVDAPHPQIGYGVQIKLNSIATIRDNSIMNTKGPGIMVYGARDITATSVVERNLVLTTRTAAGIVVGGGPVTVRNNIVVGGAGGGIALEDYGERGLLRRIIVANNTIYGALNGGITIPRSGRVEARLLYNAAHSLTGAAFPPGAPGMTGIGNVDCRPVPCFVDPFALNFAPGGGSPLTGRAAEGPGVPEDDFFGRVRPPAGTAGAVEADAEHPATLRRRSPGTR